MSNLTNKAYIHADHGHDHGTINNTIFIDQESSLNKTIEVLNEELFTLKGSLMGENAELLISNLTNMSVLPGDDDDDLDDDEDDEIDLDEELEIEADEVDVEAIEIDDEDPDDLIEDDDDDDLDDDDDIL